MRSLFLLCFINTIAFAQFEPKTTTAQGFAAHVAKKCVTKISNSKLKIGEAATVEITITPAAGNWTYPTQSSTGQTALNKIGDRIGELVVIKPIPDPPDQKTKDGVKPGEKLAYYTGEVTYKIRVVVPPWANTGKQKLTFSGTRLQVCDDDSCYNSGPEDLNPIEVEIEAAAEPKYDPNDAKYLLQSIAKQLKIPLDATATVKEPETKTAKVAEEHKGVIRSQAKPLEVYKADLEKIKGLIDLQDDPQEGDGSLMALLIAAVVWGFISLITPCVFPMIPITVSLFLKQSQKSHGGAVKHALAYCLTIIVVLGTAAAVALGSFQALSISPTMNVFLGLLLFVFALSLFGMFDIQLPGFMLRAVERRRVASGGVLGTVFGAVAFSIVSFTCVAPFLGGLAGLASSNKYTEIELGLAGLAFATAFASPFFVLAMFPSWIKKLPKSGGWLDTVKAVMGFLELAAAFKFFRTAEVRYPPVEYFTYDVVLAAWVIILIGCGLYLLGLFRLPHDEEVGSLGVPRMIFGLLFCGLGLYIAPGFLKNADGSSQKPRGTVYAWVQSFLLPEPHGELPWRSDLAEALEIARKEKKKIFIDFTGVTCTNCAINELNVFPLPQVKQQFEKYVLVQLYTDDVPEQFYTESRSPEALNAEAAVNLEFRDKAFLEKQLPLYVILEPLPNGRILAWKYKEGKINNTAKFVEFLNKP